MRAVKDKNTAPEITVRKLIYSLGFRYRIHDPSLPGKPDIVFRKKKKVIFVHGCFWHGHDCKRGNRIPISNQPYWKQKIEKNRARDFLHNEFLTINGWSIHIVWECEIKNFDRLKKNLVKFLELV